MLKQIRRYQQQQSDDNCADDTGHVEVVDVVFDPEKISYERLLEVFWAAHDPTTLNRQGHDSGTQYRSVLYYENEHQKSVMEASKKAAQKDFQDPIVTEIVPDTHFWRAEEYHQRYFDKHSGHYSCHFNRGWVPAPSEEAKPA